MTLSSLQANSLIGLDPSPLVVNKLLGFALSAGDSWQARSVAQYLSRSLTPEETKILRQSKIKSGKFNQDDWEICGGPPNAKEQSQLFAKHLRRGLEVAYIQRQLNRELRPDELVKCLAGFIKGGHVAAAVETAEKLSTRLTVEERDQLLLNCLRPKSWPYWDVSLEAARLGPSVAIIERLLDKALERGNDGVAVEVAKLLRRDLTNREWSRLLSNWVHLKQWPMVSNFFDRYQHGVGPQEWLDKYPAGRL